MAATPCGFQLSQPRKRNYCIFRIHGIPAKFPVCVLYPVSCWRFIVIDDTLGSMLRISINNLQLCVTNFIVYRTRSFASSLLIAVPRERTGINKLVIEFTVFDIDEDSLRDERKFHLGVLCTLVDFLS